MKAAYTAVLTAIVLADGVSYARPVKRWTYDELLKGSDLVVIANALETRTVPDSDQLADTGPRKLSAAQIALFQQIVGRPPAADAFVLQQVETAFHLKAVVKGALAHKKLTLVHLRWKSDDAGTRGLLSAEIGPRLIAFPAKGSHIEDAAQRRREAGQDCLLFLKLRKDGKYEPVSGQVDPIDSVRWLAEPRPTD